MNRDMKENLLLIAACREVTAHLAGMLTKDEVRTKLAKMSKRLGDAFEHEAESMTRVFTVFRREAIYWGRYRAHSSLGAAKLREFSRAGLRAYELGHRLHAMELCLATFGTIIASKFRSDWEESPTLFLAGVAEVRGHIAILDRLIEHLRQLGLPEQVFSHEPVALSSPAEFEIPLCGMGDEEIARKFGSQEVRDTRERLHEAIKLFSVALQRQVLVQSLAANIRKELKLLRKKVAALLDNQLSGVEEMFIKEALDAAMPKLEALALTMPKFEEAVLDHDDVMAAICRAWCRPDLHVSIFQLLRELADEHHVWPKFRDAGFERGPIERIQSVESMHIALLFQHARMVSELPDESRFSSGNGGSSEDGLSTSLLLGLDQTGAILVKCRELAGARRWNKPLYVHSETGKTAKDIAALGLACNAALVVFWAQSTLVNWLAAMLRQRVLVDDNSEGSKYEERCCSLAKAAHSSIAECGRAFNWGALSEAQIRRLDAQAADARIELEQLVLMQPTRAATIVSNTLITCRDLLLTDCKTLLALTESGTSQQFDDIVPARIYKQIGNARDVLAIAYEALAGLNARLVPVLQELGLPDLARAVDSLF